MSHHPSQPFELFESAELPLIKPARKEKHRVRFPFTRSDDRKQNVQSYVLTEKFGSNKKGAQFWSD